MNTSEDFHRALANLATLADDDPRPGRLDSVHQRARRTARIRAVAASVAAVVVVSGAAAVITRTGDTGAPVGPGTHTTATLTTQAPTPTTPAPTPTQTPTSSPAPSTTTLVPADQSAPAAGGCSGQAGSVVTVDANPDVPTPRCVIVRADQRIRVVNTSDLHGAVGKTITVRFANFAPRVLGVGQATTFETPAGDYLAVGVHLLYTPPLYGTSGAEIWLR